MNEVTQKLQREAERIASRHPIPEFYTRFKAPIALARRLFYKDPTVVMMRDIVQSVLQEDLGHGIFHSTHVSIDCAVLIWVEMQTLQFYDAEVERLMVLGLLAGLLHDIRREEDNHAEAGAKEALRLLRDFPVSGTEADCVYSAIRNHEAFTTPFPCRLPWIQLISDCLYDSDKFRWGVDTFTHTLWHMANHRGLTPREIVERFPWGMSGIMQIIETFRTPTGREFGPEILMTGVEIGKEIYRYLLNWCREESNEK
ncbi:MAG: hypothetical protein GX422_14115 [Deltaproteobacteria bacterium]|jgi:hypothetical protein|nr:hypothetical protein [Deltaproteobacteria bacterium]